MFVQRLRWPEEKMSVLIKDGVKQRFEEGDGVSAVPESLKEDLLELAELLPVAAVADVARELCLDEGSLHRVRVERVKGDVGLLGLLGFDIGVIQNLC